MRSTLAERYRCIAPDLRGHGAAADTQPVTLDAVLGDVLSIAPTCFTLVGYSMGGRIGLHLALRSPDLVERLVLIGASPGIADPLEKERRRKADARLAAEIERLTIEQFATRWASDTPVLANQPAAVREAVHADRLRNDPRALARALRGLGTGTLPSVWHRLGELGMPVTLIVGERDRKFRAVGEQMAAAITTAELRVVENAGHAVHLEAPRVVAGLI